MFEGDILKPVKTRPQYKHIWKEIWQVLTYPHGLLFGLVLRWWKSVRRADERRGIWNTSDGKFSDCSLERRELGYGLRLSTFCIGCHWNTLLLPDVSSTEAFDRFLRLMVCTFFSLGANPLVRWVLLDKLRAFFPFHGSIHHRLPRSDKTESISSITSMLQIFKITSSCDTLRWSTRRTTKSIRLLLCQHS